MSSVASLTAVMDNTKTRGTAVVNQGREDTCGISCQDENWVKPCLKSPTRPDVTSVGRGQCGGVVSVGRGQRVV